MNPDLERLIMLQDLDLMIRDMEGGAGPKEKEMGFSLEQQDALETARHDLAGKLNPEHLKLYEKLQERYKRVVVPVRNNTCLACFLKQPTQYSTETEDEIRTCDHCSRILYLV
jgi:predicted  nucleic acid-binding Zn-ribbon protein